MIEDELQYAEKSKQLAILKKEMDDIKIKLNKIKEKREHEQMISQIESFSEELKKVGIMYKLPFITHIFLDVYDICSTTFPLVHTKITDYNYKLSLQESSNKDSFIHKRIKDILETVVITIYPDWYPLGERDLRYTLNTNEYTIWYDEKKDEVYMKVYYNNSHPNRD
jgi:hypothetical protein